MMQNLVATPQRDTFYYNYSVLYERYHGKGPTFVLILPPLLYNLVGIPGIIMNAFVVYVTIRSKYDLAIS